MYKEEDDMKEEADALMETQEARSKKREVCEIMWEYYIRLRVL